jgi:hypothetical protein
MQDISTCEYQQMLKGTVSRDGYFVEGLMVFNAFERRFTTLYNYEFFYLPLKLLTDFENAY